MTKTFAEMNDSELFGTLSGMYGVMPQMYLRDIVLAYRKYCRANNLKADYSLSQIVDGYLNGAY